MAKQEHNNHCLQDRIKQISGIMQIPFFLFLLLLVSHLRLGQRVDDPVEALKGDLTGFLS